MIELIIFDLGKVIIDFSEEAYIKYLSRKLGVQYKVMYSAFMANINKMEKGEITLDEYKYSSLHGLKIDTKTNIEWSEAFKFIGKPNRNVQDLIKKLHKKYNTALLTNISASRYSIATRYMFEKSLFDRRFTSFRLGITKPDLLIYRIVLKRMHCEPNNAIFIDDKIENVKAAMSIGVNGIVFTGYTRMVKDLDKLGVS